MAFSDEVLALSPRAYYRMNEASGQPQDSSTSANHTTATTGTPVYAQTGLVANDPANKSILFDGVCWFGAPDHATLDLGDVFSLMAYVRRTTYRVSHAVVAKGTNAYYLGFGANDRLELAKDSVALIVQSTITVTDSAPHLCVATKNGVTSKLYIDGNDVTGTVTNATCADNTSQLFLGSGGGSFFNGNLDEIAVFPTALTAAQVMTLYQAAGGWGIVSNPDGARFPKAKLRPAVPVRY